MHIIKKCNILIVVLFFISGIVAAKDKIYPVENTASIAIVPAAESSFNLQITLNIQDNFTNWDLGFFMLKVFLDPVKTPFTAQVCKQNLCQPLVLDVANLLPAQTQADYLKPELSSGHITLFKPAQQFPLENNNTYVISINDLKIIPKNITAMPQMLFLLTNNHKNIVSLKVTAYTGYDNAKLQTLEQKRNRDNWYLLKNPAVIDSIVVPYPHKTIFTSGVVKADAKQNIYYCTQNELIPFCSAINNQAEGYVLELDPNGIVIYANTIAGSFYAHQTLSQLSNYYGTNIPGQTIIDYPRFKYRGIMLDTARHFFDVSQIKQLLDVMAAHKLNVLHLHLADDEAWRIQLANYPKLTAVGSNRVFNGIIGPSNLVDGNYDISNVSKIEYAKANTLYHGYYTKADIRELIAYANARQITIIPEIELPGHAKILKKSMPEIFLDVNDKSRYLSIQGYNDSVLPICKYGVDNKFTTTLNDIIKDITRMFAGQGTLNYIKNEISLSGDEVPANAFTDYVLCNNNLYQGLKGEEIVHEFFYQLANNLPDYKLSGYQQLVQADNGQIYKNAPNPNVIGHLWQWLPTNHKPVSGFEMSSDLSKSGYTTVLAFGNLSYFDMRYSAKWEEPGLYWAANQTDTFSALITALTLEHIADIKNIIGIEGALWSELIPGSEHLFYMAVPKMSGLADAAWSDKNDISWRSLAVRLGCGKSGFLAYLNKQYGIRYRGYPDGIRLEVPNGKLCN